uniref:Uncharacterized protein n=1 Tax=Onchocerca volvulus TaxID=6282 RepID=A0A8R1TTK6_ONCVO
MLILAANNDALTTTNDKKRRQQLLAYILRHYTAKVEHDFFHPRFVELKKQPAQEEEEEGDEEGCPIDCNQTKILAKKDAMIYDLILSNIDDHMKDESFIRVCFALLCNEIFNKKKTYKLTVNGAKLMKHNKKKEKTYTYKKKWSFLIIIGIDKIYSKKKEKQEINQQSWLIISSCTMNNLNPIKCFARIT